MDSVVLAINGIIADVNDKIRSLIRLQIKVH